MLTYDEKAQLMIERDQEKRESQIDVMTGDEAKIMLKQLLRLMHGERDLVEI